MPWPFADPAAPLTLPATIDTDKDESVTERTAWLPLSPTNKKVPLESTDNPVGYEKVPPTPFVYPDTPPSSFVTVKDAREMARSAWLPVSATYKNKEGAEEGRASPPGPLKSALVPTPSIYPDVVLPAKVDTPESTENTRMQLFPVSAMYTVAPPGTTATAEGRLKEAAVAMALSL